MTPTDTLAAIASKHKAFKPSAPTETARGWRVTFAPVAVDPRTVVNWFAAVDAVVVMIGSEVDEVDGRTVACMYAEVKA
jgi:hypothetical protein